MSPHNGNYHIRVTAKADNGIGITVGFLIDAAAYEKLKVPHSFDVQEGSRFLHCSDTEYYRIKSIIDTYTGL